MKRNQHEWSFMANPGTVGTSDLLYCPLCKQWKMDGYKDGKPFKMSNEEYIRMHIGGEIDATETIGTRENVNQQFTLTINS